MQLSAVADVQISESQEINYSQGRQSLVDWRFSRPVAN